MTTPRYYIPESDVDGSVLADSDLHTGCPYKGIASYRDVVIDGRRHPNLFWGSHLARRYLVAANAQTGSLVDDFAFSASGDGR